MNHAEFQERYEDDAARHRAKFDARPVAELLDDIRAARFGEYYQIWYSLGARASLAEAGPLLLEILESDTDYLHRYHCSAALIAIARLDPETYQPDRLSAHAVHPVRVNLAELRRLLQIAPSSGSPATSISPVAPAPAGPPVAPPPLPASPASRLLTIFAWIVMVLSTLLLPISVISLFMLIAGSYGTKNADPLGAFTVVLGPVITLVAGFGLWRRWAWAWWLLTAILALIVAGNLHTIFTVATGPQHYVSSSGVPTTVIREGASPLWGIVVVATAALLFLCTRRVRTEVFRRG